MSLVFLIQQVHNAQTECKKLAGLILLAHDVGHEILKFLKILG